MDAISIQNPSAQDKTEEKKKIIRPVKPIENFIKVFALGGLGEIGRNMYIIEYKNRIVVIDAGLRFPEEDMPGVDYIIPNIRYLTENRNRKKVIGIFVTHAHFDHIGAISYIADRIGNPPIYATPLTKALILKRHEEFRGVSPLNVIELKKNDSVKIEPFTIETFHQNHSVFDSVGFVIKTPVGNIVNTGDFKFDMAPIGDEPADLARIAAIGQNGVLLLMQDSTRAESPGFSLSETTIQTNLEEIFRIATGRIIVATFGSLLTRIQQIITLSEKYGRHVLIEGRSMISAVEIAYNLGYLKIQKNTLIKKDRLMHYPKNKITVLCTGAQGEPDAVLMRIVNKDHKYIKIEPGDAFVFSSSVIPGNERAVQSLKDALARDGALVFHNQMMDIHAGGHAHKEDLRMMLALLKPKFFMPIHGNFTMLAANRDLALSMGLKPNEVVIAENGQVVKLYKNKIVLTQEKVPTNFVFIDGLGIGDVGNIVLRDRQTMSKDGMFVVITIIDAKNGQLKDEPDIISRGFVYLKESQKLLEDTRMCIRNLVHSHIRENGTINYTYLKNLLRDELGKFLFKRTHRRPLVLPVVIEV